MQQLNCRKHDNFFKQYSFLFFILSLLSFFLDRRADLIYDCKKTLTNSIKHCLSFSTLTLHQKILLHLTIKKGIIYIESRTRGRPTFKYSDNFRSKKNKQNILEIFVKFFFFPLNLKCNSIGGSKVFIIFYD